MGRHFKPEEIIKVLAEGESDRCPREDVWRRYKISKPTYYRWKAAYMASDAERDLVLSARDADAMQCRHIAWQLKGLRTPSTVDVLGPWEDRPGGLDYLAWAAEKEAEEQKQLEKDAKHFRALLKQLPVTQYAVHQRVGPARVRVHGKLPRGEFTTVNVHLPDDLHWRLTRQADGSLNQSISALLRYALDCLDAEHLMLDVFAAGKARPEQGLRNLKPLIGPEEAERQKTLRKKILAT